MGKNINIYLDDASSFALESARKKDPDFNVSSFLQGKLLNMDEKQDDPNVLALEIEKKQAIISQIRVEIQILDDKKVKIEAKRKLEVEEHEQDRIRQERKRVEFVKTYVENMLYFFDVSKDQAEEIAGDMWNTPKEQRKSILDEGRARGFKEKELK